MTNPRCRRSHLARVFALLAVTGCVTASPVAAQATIPFKVATLNVAVNDLAWDPYQRKIYLSLPSTAPELGNSIVAVDPATGAVGPTAFAGSEPGRLAISGDGLYLYVGLNGANSIQRFHLPDLTLDLTFSLGSDSFLGPRFAGDIQVAPGDSHTVAVSEVYQGVDPDFAEVAIFDDGVARPETIGPNSFAFVNSLQFGKNASTLYGYNNEDTGFNFYQMSVSPGGLTLGQSAGNLLSGFSTNIHFDLQTGLVYGDNGGVIDPVALTLVGTYAAQGVMVPDAEVGRSFFVTSDLFTSDVQIEAFDKTRFTPIGSIDIGDIFIPNSQVPASLIRFGPSGLASRTTGSAGKVYLVYSPIVLPPSATANPAPLVHAILPTSGSVGGGNLLMLVEGSNFVLGSTVLWNGAIRTTRFLSGNYLLAWIPTTDLAAAGTAQVSVATPAPSGGLSASVSFPIH